MALINARVLMSGTDYFDDGFAINAYMDDNVPVDRDKAAREHAAIEAALQQAGIGVLRVTPPPNCQDGVYTANWALISGNTAVMANLPNVRQAEEAYAEGELQKLGYKTVRLPQEVRFSGQGDALPCGPYLFVGSQYRTDVAAHELLQSHTGLKVVGLQTIPQLNDVGMHVRNKVTGWPDSFFYDLDLALAVISPACIAWCPEAFVPESRERIETLTDIEKIEVSLEEAMQGFACNLVSTGTSVVMSSRAPHLRSKLEALGLTVYAPEVTELLKGGGFIRCTTLTLC